MILLRTAETRIEGLGEHLELDGVAEDRKTYYTPSNSNVSSITDGSGIGRGFRYPITYTNTTGTEDVALYKRMVFETVDADTLPT